MRKTQDDSNVFWQCTICAMAKMHKSLMGCAQFLVDRNRVPIMEWMTITCRVPCFAPGTKNGFLHFRSIILMMLMIVITYKYGIITINVLDSVRCVITIITCSIIWCRAHLAATFIVSYFNIQHWLRFTQLTTTIYVCVWLSVLVQVCHQNDNAKSKVSCIQANTYMRT